MARSPRPKGGVALCPRFTATSVAASSRTSRPSSIGRREPAPSSRCPNPRPVPVRPRWSTSTRPCSVVGRMTRRRTARRHEKRTRRLPLGIGGRGAASGAVGCYSFTTFCAAGPFCPCTTSNSTRWPSASVLNPSAWIAVWCTKQSFSPFSGVMKPKPFASLNHFTIPVMRAICCTPDLMVFAAASGLHLAARRCLVLPPTLSARTLVEALPLHVLEQSGSGDLAAELLQDVVQSVVVAQRHFHPASFLRRESPPETRRGPRAVAQVLGTVSGSYRAPEHRWGGRIC